MKRRIIMSDGEWADRVMAIINSRPSEIRLGAWSALDRDVIRAGLHVWRWERNPRFELIVDDGRGDWRLKPNPEGHLRLADYRMSRVGHPDDEAVTEINEELARLGLGLAPWIKR